MEDIVNDVIVENLAEDLSAQQVLDLWKTINNAMFDRLANGYSVDNGIGILFTRITGPFSSEADTFQKDRNTIDLSFRTDSRTKEMLKDIPTVIRQGNETKPQIVEVEDVESQELGRLTPGGFLNITGTNIMIAGDDDRNGLDFVNAEDESKSVHLPGFKMGINMGMHVACVIPTNLTPGIYHLMLTTQYLRPKTFRKIPLSYTFPTAFTV